MRRRAAVLTALVAFTGACSLFVSTSDYAGDPSEDAGSAADAGSAPDGALGDAATSSDADATPKPGARFCDGHTTALFCEDFAGPAPDQHMALQTDQGGMPDGGKASVTIDTADFLSPPGALHVVTDKDGAGAYLSKGLLSAPNGVACEVSFRADRGPDLDYKILELRTESAIGALGSARLGTYPPSVNVPLTTLATSPPSWRRWRLSVAPALTDAGPKAGQRRIWVEEVSPNPRLLAESWVDDPQPLADMSVALGVSGYEAPSIDFHFDDLLCEKLAP